MSSRRSHPLCSAPSRCSLRSRAATSSSKTDACGRLFQDPNVFGPFLVPAALILIEELLSPRVLRVGRSRRRSALVALTLGVLFSFSRGAWLNLALGVAVMFVVLLLRRGGARRAMAFARRRALCRGPRRRNGCGERVVRVPRRASASTELRRGALRRAGRGDQCGGAVSARRRARAVRADRADLSAQHLRPGARRAGHRRARHARRAAALHAGRSVRNALLGRDTYGIGSAALLGAWCGILANSFFVDTLHWRHLWVVAALIWAGSMRRRTAGRA